MSSPSSFNGSFNGLARSMTTSIIGSTTIPSAELQDLTLEAALSRLEIETRLKEGAENLLQVLDTRTRERPRDVREARRWQVTDELNQTNARITTLKFRIESLLQISTSGRVNRRQRSEERLAGRPKLATIQSYSSSKRTSEVEVESASTAAELISRLSVSGQEEASYYISGANDLIRMFRSNRSIKHKMCQASMLSCLSNYLTSSNTSMVAAGYRLARHIIWDLSTLQAVWQTGLDRCLISSLSRDHRHALEREQAIKLIRCVYAINDDAVSGGIIRALVAVADGDDRLSLIALETIAEMILHCPVSLAKHGGIRCLLNSLVDGTPALSDEIVMVLLYSLDSPKVRQNIDARIDLQAIFLPFTEYTSDNKLPSLEKRLITSTTVISRMLDSWPGLLSLSMFNAEGLRSVIGALYVPRSVVREAILDFIFCVLSIPVNNLSSSFLAGRRLTTLGRIPLSAEYAANNGNNSEKVHTKRHGLFDQFSALKLSLLLEIGLLDALMVVVEDQIDGHASRKATLLLGEVLQLTNNLLPLARSRDLQTLPRLFCSATDLRRNERLNATAALFQIESLNRTRNKTSLSRLMNSADHINNKRGQRQVEQVKIKMGLQIDDSHFRNLLLDTQVLSTKNYTKWHWDTLTELVQGPLLNPKRLEESMRATKFMKRLLAFYRPFTHRFSAIRNTKPNQKYIKFGCLLLNTLLANPDGVKYLTESKLLRQLSECLAQMDPMNHVTASDLMFSKARLEETLCHGYFEFIGTLTAHSQGSSMMERWRMFSSLYHLADLRSRGDLVMLFLSHMDYTYAGHPRIIMSKALTTGLLDVRLFATEHLSSLIARTSEKSKKTASWAIRLLVLQLYDPNIEVCEAAVRVLHEVCNSREHLDYMVEIRPAFDHLGDIGAPLLLRFLATSKGFHYLKELDYIDHEMDDWFLGRNDEYVTLVEATWLHARAPRSIKDPSQPSEHLPAHFYGELAKTEEGVALLLEKGHFTLYVDLLRRHWHEHTDLTIVHHVKAALWAIGSIGATERGAPFLKDTDVTQSIVNIAQESQIATLKGTAYLVLGLLSVTTVGVRLLAEYNWSASLTSMGSPTGICVPQKLSAVLNLQPWDPIIVIVKHEEKIAADYDPLSTEIMLAMTNLSNHILANGAAKALIRLRQKYPDKFMSSKLYDLAFGLLGKYSFRLEVRRFLIELFPNHSLMDYVLSESQRCHR